MLRALTGIGAALLMPGTLSTITSVFPPEERAKAVGIWAGFAGAGGTLGILASGALLEQFSWNSIFVVTAVLAALACIGVVLVVPSTRAEERVAFDPAVRSCRRSASDCSCSASSKAPSAAGPTRSRSSASSAASVFLATFVWIELRTDEPLLDPRLFRHRGFATGSASLFLQFFAMFGFFFVSLQFLQLVLGYSTFEAALALLPMSIVILPDRRVRRHAVGAVRPPAGRRRRVGDLRPSGSRSSRRSAPGAASGRSCSSTIVIGAGAALAMTPATNAIVASLPRAKQGVASAVNDTARELGAAFGVAVLGSAFNIGYRNDIDADLTQLPGRRRPPGARGAGDRGAARPGGSRAASTLADAAREAFTTGMRYSVLVGTGLLVIGAVFVWFHGASAHGATRRGRSRRDGGARRRVTPGDDLRLAP